MNVSGYGCLRARGIRIFEMYKISDMILRFARHLRICAIVKLFEQLHEYLE